MNNKLINREKWDINKISENKEFYYSCLPEHRKTAAVSLAAVSASANNLEYVPDYILNRDICRAALSAKDAEYYILPQIPFPDVQKEGIKKFSSDGGSAFIVHSFIDISDAQMAQDAVKADAYCIQLVPDKLITADLCKTALQHPEVDKKVLDFIPERYRNIPGVKKMAEEKFGNNPEQRETSIPPKRKGLSIN